MFPPIFRHYSIHQLAPYINWTFFLFAWGIKGGRYGGVAAALEQHDCPACREHWIRSFATEAEQGEAREAVRLYLDARRRLVELEVQGVCAHGLFALFSAHAEADDIVVHRPDGTAQHLPFMRQQHTDPKRPNLCLADFIAPEGYDDPTHTADRLGAFATTVDELPDTDDPYERMLVQTLLDRLAEAAAEKLHQEIRTHLWGYAPDEQCTVQQLFAEEYQGIRPAVGYPSIPDQSFNFVLYDLFPMRELGITLTENGMMRPHASVSGLLFAHPAARYFAIGAVSDEQLADYAHRRGTTPEALRKFVPQS